MRTVTRRWIMACGLYPVFSAPALSEGALGATVRRSRPTSCRQPEHRSRRTRSAAAASFARCIIVKIYYRQSGGAKSGDEPDKAGANIRGVMSACGLVEGTSQVYRSCTVCGRIRVFFFFEECISLTAYF